MGWNEADLRRTVALMADLLEGQETAYHRYTPTQFRRRLRTHWISERESMGHLMKKNIELQKSFQEKFRCVECIRPDDCEHEGRCYLESLTVEIRKTKLLSD